MPVANPGVGEDRGDGGGGQPDFRRVRAGNAWGLEVLCQNEAEYSSALTALPRRRIT